MHFNYGDKAIPANLVTYRVMGFGEPVGSDITREYSLHIATNAFCSFIRGSYDTFVDECLKDDREGDFRDPIPGLVASNYLKFERAFSAHRRFTCEVIRNYLYDDLLDALFGANEPMKCFCAINSVEDIGMANDSVVIRGDAYVFPGSCSVTT